MKYFTPNLLERFGSDDDQVALAAQEELEKRSDEYVRHLGEIELQLPDKFRELQQRYYLHDARVNLLGFRDDTFWIALLPDAPPRDTLILQYRSARLEEVGLGPSVPGDPCPYLEWQYDEIDLAASPQGPEFVHSILLTNNYELRVRFHEFDFVTLKPVVGFAEHHWRAVS